MTFWVTIDQRQKAQVDAIRNADASDTQQVAAFNLALNNEYCEAVIKHANRSFWSAIIAASVGLVFFVMASALLMLYKQDATQLSLITSLGAAITAFVSGTSFYLYTHAMRHFEAFHMCLARTEIVLLENSICCKIHDPAQRDAAFAGVVGNIEKLAIRMTSYEPRRQESTKQE